MTLKFPTTVCSGLHPLLALPGAAMLGLSACAGATVGSGVGDLIVERPPYYAGTLDGDSAAIGHIPITYQRGAAQEPTFDPGQEAGSPVARVLAEMNAYLDSLNLTTAVQTGAQPSGLRGPDIQFGCIMDATGDCEDRAGARVRMRLAVTRPSAQWTAWAGAAADGAAVERFLALTLEVGSYWPRQRNLLGAKEVELGTGHVQRLPWLTSLDAPVSVLQLTGALMGRDGRAIRIGAEGLLARRTTLLAGAFGAQRLITDEDVEQLRTIRREDLPGQPLVWQVALRELVRGLTGGVFQ
jgi:hypothetical protein